MTTLSGLTVSCKVYLFCYIFLGYIKFHFWLTWPGKASCDLVLSGDIIHCLYLSLFSSHFYLFVWICLNHLPKLTIWHFWLVCLCLFVIMVSKACFIVCFILTIWVTWQVSYKRQEMLTIHKHLGSPPVFGESVLLIFLVFCVVFFVLFVCVLCSQYYQFLWIVYSWLPLRFSLTFNYSNYFPLLLTKWSRIQAKFN